MRNLLMLLFLFCSSISSGADECIEIEDAMQSARNFSHNSVPSEELELLIESLEFNQDNQEYTSSATINEWDNGDETADLVVSCDGQVSVFLNCFGDCE